MLSVDRIQNLFKRGYDKWVVLIKIHDIDTLVSQKKHFQRSFCLESKFILKMGRTSFVHRIQSLSMIGQKKWIILIGIHNIEALVSRQKYLCPSFCLESKIVLKTRRTSSMDRIQFLFIRGQDKSLVLIEIHDIDAFDSRKKHLQPSFCLDSKFVLKMGRTWSG